MFASFYPFTKARTGTERVDASLDYVYGDKTSSGFDRLIAPETVCGTDVSILRPLAHDLGLERNNPATIGSVNVEECLGSQRVWEIARSFFKFAFAGIDPSQWAYHAVRHEKRLKLSGLISTDIHFIILNSLLGTGRSFIPYFPKADFFGYMVWAEMLNYQLGLSSKWDPAKRRILVPRVYGHDADDVVVWKRDIGALVSSAYRADRLRSSGDVIDLLQASPGIVSANAKGLGVSVTIIGIDRPIQLHAPVFAPDFEPQKLKDEIARQQRMTEDECKTAYEGILSARIDRHHQRYGRRGPRWVIQPKKTNQKPNKNQNELPIFYSQPGQLWRRAIELDAKYGSALLRLGETCDDLGRRLQQVGAVLGDCLEETEPVGLRCGGDQSILADLAAGSEAIRGAVDHAHRALANPRPTFDQRGVVPRELQEFHGAVQRLGQQFADLPGSVAEMRMAIERLLQNCEMSPKQKSWLQDSGSTIRPDIWSWLRFLQPDDYLELKEQMGIREGASLRIVKRTAIGGLD